MDKVKDRKKKRAHTETSAEVVDEAGPAPSTEEELGKSPKKVKETTAEDQDANILSEMSFEELDVSEETKKAIREMGFKNMTEVQAKTIPSLLQVCCNRFDVSQAVQGRDVLGAARTGSGKTLAFLTPAVELLRRAHFMPRNGIFLCSFFLVLSDRVSRHGCDYHYADA